MKSVRKSIDVIEALYELDGARLTELAGHLELPKSFVHRHVTTLEREHYVTREEDTYYLSLQFLELGDYVQHRDSIRTFAEPIVEELSEDTGERAQFVVEEHGYIRYVHRATGQRAVKTISGIGKRVRMHAVAGGKAILAYRPEEDVRRIVEQRGLPAFTDNTITDRTVLFEELASIRERGTGFDDEECVSGLRAVGVPVFGPDGDVLGALTIAGPTHRLQDEVFESELPDLLLGAANELELKVAYE